MPFKGKSVFLLKIFRIMDLKQLFSKYWWGMVLVMTAWGASPLMATHISSGQLTYEWIGDEPGQGLRDYRVYLTLFANLSGVSVGTTQDICVEALNSNYSSTHTLNALDPANPLPPKYSLSPSNPVGWIDAGAHPTRSDAWAVPGDTCNSNVLFGEYRYVGVISIPASITGSVRLSTELICCRGWFGNLGGLDPTFLALFKVGTMPSDNKAATVIPRSKPYYNLRQAQDPPLKIKFRTYNPDGDSLRFKLATVRDGNCSNGISNVIYTNGFSAQSPFPSSIPISINPRTGTITAKPDSTGTYLAKIRVEEYRLVAGSWIRAGFLERELPIVISNQYYSPTSNPWSLQVDTTMPDSNGIATLGCGDTLIRLQAPVNVDENSLSSDGSEFSLSGSAGNYPIKSATLNAQNEILLSLADTVATEDTLQLTLRMGRDTNLIYDVCDQKVVRDTFTLYTQCQYSGVGLPEKAAAPLKVYPNPMTDKLQVLQQGAPRVIRLINAQGQVVRRMPAHQRNTELSIQDLAPGLYWVAVGPQRKRVVKR